MRPRSTGRRDLALVLAVSALAVILPPGRSWGGTAGSADGPVVRWNRATLALIAQEGMGPTIASRVMALVHTCIYDAWAAYDPVAAPTTPDVARRADRERTPASQAEAIEHAAHRAVTDLFPGHAARASEALAAGGYPTGNGSSGGGAAGGEDDPARVGRRACAGVLARRHADGSNQFGDHPDSAGGPYSDWTGYVPANSPDELGDPARWQPLRVEDPAGPGVQRFLTPHWGRVAPFAPAPPGGLPALPGPARPGQAEFDRQVAEVLELSAGLTDEQKMIAEYWGDGTGTVTPPGHWMGLAQLCSRRDGFKLDQDVKAFFGLSNALFDAGVAAWAEKRSHDSVRPVSAIPWRYGGQQVRAWGGPGRGTVTMPGSGWRPYLATPPFPEYVSGHSTFSAAAAEILTLATGTGRLGLSVRIPAGSSRIEPGTTPAADVVLSWPTFRDAARQAGMSRLYGGIHFASGDRDGQLLGRAVAARTWARVSALFAGVSPVAT